MTEQLLEVIDKTIDSSGVAKVEAPSLLMSTIMCNEISGVLKDKGIEHVIEGTSIYIEGNHAFLVYPKEPEWRPRPNVTANIAYGINLNPDVFGAPLPWDNEQFVGDWWRLQKGFALVSNGEVPSDEYIAEQRAFDLQHPLPVVIWHEDGTAYVAAKGTLLTANHYPLAFDPASLAVTPESLAGLEEFMAELPKYFNEQSPHWFLVTGS